MAAPTQTAANKSALSMVSQNNDEEGLAYFSFLGVRFGAGTGEPNSELSGGQKGDIFINLGSPALDMFKVAGAQDWEHVGDQT